VQNRSPVKPDDARKSRSARRLKNRVVRRRLPLRAGGVSTGNCPPLHRSSGRDVTTGEPGDRLMSDYDTYEVAGAARDEILFRCRRQIDAWGLTMPPVTPIVLQFGLNEFDRFGLVEFWIANEKQAGYCGKFLFLFDGQACPAHRHAKKHETFFVVRGTVRIVVDGRETVKNAGDILPMPPGTEHSFTGRGPALLLEVSSPCLLDDNFFADKRIGANGTI